MRKTGWLIAVLGLSFVLFAVQPAWAEGNKTSEGGRYQVYFNPTDKNISYLVDTQDGRVWQSTVDNKIKLKYWRPMPVEGLDYPISSYKKTAVKFFFKKERGLAN